MKYIDYDTGLEEIRGMNFAIGSQPKPLGDYAKCE